ncbi:MAG: ABC transporter substrate-binding protein, partial [candidate division NC10 bacterium]
SYYTTVAGPASVFPEARKFIADHTAKYKKAPEPYATEAYDSTGIILKALERAINANKGNKPTREQVAKAVRATKGHKGLTGTITFDEKGDRAKAGYYILKVLSEDPGKWAGNELIKTLEIAAPPLKKM